MTAPDPGLTDLIAAHAADGISPDGNLFCHCKWVIVDGKHELNPDGWFGPAKDHPAHVAEAISGSYDITPKLVAKPGIPCGDWADGHSYRKCTRPKGHEGHHG